MHGVLQEIGELQFNSVCTASNLPPGCSAFDCYQPLKLNREWGIVKNQLQNYKVDNSAKRFRKYELQQLRHRAIWRFRGSLGTQPGNLPAPTPASPLVKVFIVFFLPSHLRTSSNSLPIITRLEEQSTRSQQFCRLVQNIPKTNFSDSAPNLKIEL